MISENILVIMINTLDFTQYNQETLKRLKEINNEIREEESKEEVDEKKVTKLRMAQLMRGLELNYGSEWIYG